MTTKFGQKKTKEIKEFLEYPGFYKVVSFVALSNKIELDGIIVEMVERYFEKNKKFQQKYITDESFTNNNYSFNGDCISFSCRKNENYLFFNSNNFTDREATYISRCSDLIVFVIEKEIDNLDRFTMLMKNLPSFLFLYLNKENKYFIQKNVEKYIPKAKILYKDDFLAQLPTIKTFGTRICENRPYFVPKMFLYDNINQILEVEGYMNQGILSDKLICNGELEFIIEEYIIGDKRFSNSEIKNICSQNYNINILAETDDLEKHNLNIERQNIKENYNEEDLDIEESYESTITEEENSNKYELSETEASGSILEDKIDLIEKYSGYRGIKNLSTCNLISKEYPDYYENLIFLKNYKGFEKYSKNLESGFGNHQIVKMKLRKISNIEFNFKSVVFFNILEYEDSLSIFNVSFESNNLIKDFDKLFFDFGYKIIEATPILTNNSSDKIHKKLSETKSGVMTFIAPLCFNVPKVLIMDSSNNILATSTVFWFGDRNIVEEVTLKGYSIKVNKKSVTVKRMFSSKNEVLYFRNIDIHTRNNMKGIIKKPIGTHGMFKAYFPKSFKGESTVFMSLYKQIFPKLNK
ncbi:ribosome biogenesis protein tsr1 [Hamiltosporidium tvaerminnensis]|nr:ribosome biogenesis protein tsr1 [Hamiltosporidium tvaerminnensis]